ncbi:hypothetical protein AOQ73_33270 [Bradyrhizobium pachyrhizi]|uniref:hypothetical protein n=1 Tax=Bradyrhizobium pachyrhizi TaxID=280333 RepID=UPI000704B210|nr:hypothetical protein [Bradyrhizobium pachyrhizi]KRP86986.1 hypothetical protein AOQ73_33270 [Bradyrhizobium pachyrhizi]
MITAEAIAKPEITRIATLRSKLNQFFFLEPGLAMSALKHDPEKCEAVFRRNKTRIAFARRSSFDRELEHDDASRGA